MCGSGAKNPGGVWELELRGEVLRGKAWASVRAGESHLGTGTHWDGVNTARPVDVSSLGSPEAGQWRRGCHAQHSTAAGESGLRSQV